MEGNSPSTDVSGDEDPIVAAVDAIDSRDHLVIADISEDDAWIAVPEGKAKPLAASR